MSNSILTYQVLFEVAQLLKDLQNDPKALQKAAEESYALGEAEKKRAAEAKQAIVDNKELLEQLKLKGQQLGIARGDLDAQAQKIASLEAEHKERLAAEYEKLDAANVLHTQKVSELSQRSKDLDAKVAYVALREKEHELNVEAFSEKVKGLAKYETELALRAEGLDVRKADIDAYEAKLKARAAKLREQTEGL